MSDDPVVDVDGDGVADIAVDNDVVNGIAQTLDADLDGVPNFLDIDSDNDGISDIMKLEEKTWIVMVN